MKKKIVIRVRMDCDKCRSKAMELGASVEGTESIAIEGENKDQLVLVGEGIDPVCLTRTLRKKLGYADIIKVEEVKKETKKDDENPGNPPPTKVIEYWYPQHYPPPPCPTGFYYVDDDCNYYNKSSDPNICTIM